MIGQTRTAGQQIQALLDHYIARERDGAIDNLNRAVREALNAIEADPQAGRPYPASYRALAQRGFSWVKVGRYWFAYTTRKGYPVVTNVFYEAANIPGRIAGEDEEVPVIRVLVHKSH